MKLKHACTDAGQYGLNVSASDYVSSGVRLIRTSDLSDAGLAPPEDGVFVEGPIDQRFQLATGDVLLSRSGTIGRSFLVPPEAACDTFAGFLVRFRPTSLTDSRFLHYVTLSAPFQASVAAEAVTSTIQNFNAERYANLEVPDHSIRDQWRIADFLDDRVAHIDKIIAARKSQAEGLHRLFGSMLEETLWTTRQTMPIKHLVRDVTSGPRGWGALVGDEGIPFVRIGNLPALGITLRRTELARVDPPADAESRRASLQRDDVLLSITAAFGQVAVYDADDPAAFSQHVARLRPRDHVDARWMAWTLQTPSLHDQYRLSAYGGTKIGLGLDQVRNLRMPSLPERTRASSARAVDAAWDRLSTETRAIRTSIALFTEYKQALITAAVTGELDVTTASKALPE